MGLIFFKYRHTLVQIQKNTINSIHLKRISIKIYMGKFLLPILLLLACLSTASIILTPVTFADETTTNNDPVTVDGLIPEGNQESGTTTGELIPPTE